jgi:hypothetical protein
MNENAKATLRFWVITTVCVKIMKLMDVTPCSLTDRYQCNGNIRCLNVQAYREEGVIFLQQ